jgi:chitinase domain-containing protein 1
MSEATYARSQRRRRGRLPHRPHLPLLVLLLLALAHSLPASAAAKPERRKLEPRSGPTPRSIQERGLAGPHVSAADLAEGGREFDAAVARRRFRGSVLAYVTPWHRGGYEAAVRFRGKLTHVSPVWYQVR